MFGRLLLLFLITPVIELALLIRVGMWIGYWETIAIIAVTAVAGSYLAKREGLSVWKRFNQKLAQGGLPGHELVDGLIILVAGALLITPGVLTDIAGFAGLIPLSRHYIRRYVYKRLEKASRKGTSRVYFGSASFGESGYTTYPSESAGGSPADQETASEWGGRSRTVPQHDQPVDEKRSKHEPDDEES